MNVKDLMNYQITSIRTPISATSFAIPCGISEAGEYIRVANFVLCSKEEIADIFLEDGKLIIKKKDDAIISMTFVEDEMVEE